LFNNCIGFSSTKMEGTNALVGSVYSINNGLALRSKKGTTSVLEIVIDIIILRLLESDCNH
jgi:hypothetical protein